jgi:hypothetical protein
MFRGFGVRDTHPSRKVRGSDGAPSSFLVQALHNFGDVVFLKQTDSGDTSCAGFDARVGIFQSDTA